MDVQTARLMLIHQMLGTRMSDTLTLRTDCLIEKDGETIIQIHQMKTHFYEKPISQELAALIKEAIRYREKEHGKGKYIFTSLSDPSKPMKYATVQQKLQIKYIRKISEMIRENILDSVLTCIGIFMA
ncbi:MAG: tyrosine-type recombinase/integrase [Lachnospiraceae bacterium]